jgi:hypothetical protein
LTHSHAAEKVDACATSDWEKDKFLPSVAMANPEEAGGTLEHQRCI